MWRMLSQWGFPLIIEGMWGFCLIHHCFECKQVYYVNVRERKNIRGKIQQQQHFSLNRYSITTHNGLQKCRYANLVIHIDFFGENRRFSWKKVRTLYCKSIQKMHFILKKSSINDADLSSEFERDDSRRANDRNIHIKKNMTFTHQ